MAEGDRLTLWQRSTLRRMRRASRKREGEPLTSEDWEAYYRLMSSRSSRLWMGLLRSLPSSPRCGICGAPFAGFGSRLVKPLGYRPSRKNPTLCDTCIEASPPRRDDDRCRGPLRRLAGVHQALRAIRS